MVVNVFPEYQATKIIDPELSRASISEDTETTLSLKPGIEMCDEHVVEVNVCIVFKDSSVKFPSIAVVPLCRSIDGIASVWMVLFIIFA